VRTKQLNSRVSLGAINALINDTQTDAKKEKWDSYHYDENMPTEQDHCYQLAKSF